MTPSQHPGVARVEADGHLPALGRVLDGDEPIPADELDAAALYTNELLP